MVDLFTLLYCHLESIHDLDLTTILSSEESTENYKR